MDYTTQPLIFRIRKVARYTRMYGVARTRVKVLAQYHMKRRFDSLPARGDRYTKDQSVALIGCGNYAFGNIAYYLTRRFGHVIAACMDTDIHRAASLAQHYRAPYYTDNVDELIGDPRIRMLYIASNHASHAEYAIAGLKAGKHVYVEKPHVVSEDQLHRLVRASDESEGRVFLGFNRPGSRFGKLILHHLDHESGPGVYNWFVAGHAIDPEHWYYRPEEGGRVLGNLCHWTDFVLRMAPGARFPVRIQPSRGSRSDTDIVVTFLFPDETLAAISFSAKGHTFEGVKERLSAHRGNALMTMDDYETLHVDVGPKRYRYRNWLRDHGHEANITSAYRSVFADQPYDRDVISAYVADTAWLFLKTREALESGAAIEVKSFARSTNGST